jgi:hypothetical protein
MTFYFSPHKTAIAAKLSGIRNQTATFFPTVTVHDWALWLFFLLFQHDTQHSPNGNWKKGGVYADDGTSK